jgi:hypothetical protein
VITARAIREGKNVAAFVAGILTEKQLGDNRGDTLGPQKDG